MPPVYLFNSICQHGDDFEHYEDIIENIEDEESHENTFEDGVAWGGIDNRYFAAGLAVKQGIESCGTC